MKSRIVTGDEREQLLGSRAVKGFDYTVYLAVLNSADVGDVIAVEIDGSQRAEKVRFSRAASRIGKSVKWLPKTDAGEIVFEVASQKPANVSRKQ